MACPPRGLGEGLDDLLALQVGPGPPAQRVAGAPLLQLPPPGGQLQGLSPFQHLPKHGAGIPHDGNVGAHQLPDLRRVDVHVDDGVGMGGKAGNLPRDPVVKAEADGQDEVRMVDGPVGGHGAVHSRHPQPKGMVPGEGPQAHEGGDHGDSRPLGKGQKLPVGVLGPTPHHQDRPLRLLQGIQSPFDLLGVALGGGLVPGKLQLHVKGTGEFRQLHILGQIDQHRPRPPAGGDVEGLPHHPGDVVHLLHQVVVLGDGHGHPGDVRLLEGVGSDEGPGDVPGDGHHRGGVHVGIRQAGHQVQGPWTAGGHHHPHLARSPGVGGGGVDSPLLVPHQDVADRAVI